jgi:hypothetical protein
VQLRPPLRQHLAADTVGADDATVSVDCTARNPG